MRRLFWKLFFSVWVSLLLFSAGLLLGTSQYLESLKRDLEATNSAGSLSQRVTEARDAAHSGGLAGLKKWARHLDETELAPVLLLDDDGNDLLNRQPSFRAKAHLRRNLNGEDQATHNHMVELPGDDGAHYWIISDSQGITLSRLIARPGVAGIQLVLATLVGGAVCLFLASYLTAPLKRMQLAAQAYGQGKFGTKVTPTLGGRRDEIVDLAMTMDQMGERIEELLKSERNLLRDVSHELRSPLARIQAAIGLMRQGGSGSDPVVGLARIEQESRRIDELISRLLTIARLEAGLRTLRSESFDLGSLVRDVVSGAQIEAQAKNCRIVCHADDEEADYSGDAALLGGALDNVLRNAIRHSPAGGQVMVSLQREAGTGYLLEISDNGNGVPEEMLDSIFAPFVRVDDARDPSGGSGLGLAIARQAVEAHGGQVSARNRPQGGLQVIVRLP
jgi:two-component system sensor histidine kinase CpxA